MNPFSRCFIMLCTERTEEECLERNLFGDKAKRFQCLSDVKQGDIGFLLNVSKNELVGIFRARSEVRMNIEPNAWNGRFASQVPVELVGKLKRIKDATFILKKAGIEMAQLASGAPVPEFPVHGREVGNKILANFEEPIK